MKNYLTLGVVRINSGEVMLSQEQAQRRRRFLKMRDGKPLPVAASEITDGTYTIAHPCEFKAGEIVGMSDAGMTRALEHSLHETKDKPEILRGEARARAVSAARSERESAASRKAAEKATKDRAEKRQAAERNAKAGNAKASAD